MLVVYKTISNKELRSGAKDAIVQITEWFKKNPTKTNCNAGLFYGRRLDIKPDTVAQQVNALVDELVTEAKDRKVRKARAKK